MGKTARRVAVAVSVLLLAGCWPVPGQNADRTAHNAAETAISPANVDGLTQAWSVQPRPGRPVKAPVVSTEGVHATLGGCALVTLDPARGTVRWISAAYPELEQCDLYAGAMVYTSPPFVVGDRVYAGVFFWIRGGASPLFGSTTRGFAAADGSYQVSHGEGVIAAARGNVGVFMRPQLLTFPGGLPYDHGPMEDAAYGPIDGPYRRIRVGLTPASGSPTLGPTRLFHAGTGLLATEPGEATLGESVRAYSLTEERPGCGTDATYECPLWSAPVSGHASTSPVIAPDQATVYAGTDTGDVYALDTATGAVRWTASLGAAVQAAPALADGVLYVPLADGRLVALAADGCGAATCGLLWSGATGSSIDVQPAVAGGVVFTGSADGGVHGFAAAGCGAATCEPLWTVAAGSAITGAPAVSNGSVYVGTADGRLIAYR